LKRGASSFLHKPSGLDQLLTAVTRALAAGSGGAAPCRPAARGIESPTRRKT
jgi:hypothetical protein